MFGLEMPEIEYGVLVLDECIYIQSHRIYVSMASSKAQRLQ